MSSDFLHFKAKNGGSIFLWKLFFDGIVGVNQVSTRIVVIIIDCKVICKYSPVNKTFNDKVFKFTAQNYSKSFLSCKLQIIQTAEVSRQRSLLNKLANQSSH